jgi:hypothetical protein
MAFKLLLPAALVALAVTAPNPAAAVPRQDATTTSTPVASPSSACSNDQAWLLPTQDQWNQTGTDQFLQQWIIDNQDLVAQYKDTGGLVSAFSDWALHEPQVTCKMDGSTDCSFDSPCKYQQFLTLGNNSETAYFVLQGIQHLSRLHFWPTHGIRGGYVLRCPCRLMIGWRPSTAAGRQDW